MDLPGLAWQRWATVTALHRRHRGTSIVLRAALLALLAAASQGCDPYACGTTHEFDALAETLDMGTGDALCTAICYQELSKLQEPLGNRVVSCTLKIVDRGAAAVHCSTEMVCF